jgi:aryl carrier-like protein
MINFTDFHQLDPLVRDGVIGQGGVVNHVRTQFPLVVEAERAPGSDDLMVSVQLRSEYWKPADAERLLRCLRETFAAVTADPAHAMPDVAAPSPAPVHDTEVIRPEDAPCVETSTEAEPRPVSPAQMAATPLAGDWDLFVADHWRTVLGVLPQTRETTFSDLGGTSLTVMRLLGRYTQRGFPVKVVDLLEHDTVAAQADLLATRGNGGR